eukprot:CAMPEP_0194043044 /NCGR_PEP_ID=MMETSP0009_2-20130614/14738_1 /TAXON_ID=210454 /ORGANISM="Grammatophora oceanica, Strain CCMP 410" /LENGTH=43 /DNA_ID= /DNA_START= /DNA_END= /DNA_ORIENTATION=
MISETGSQVGRQEMEIPSSTQAGASNEEMNEMVKRVGSTGVFS